MKMKKLQPLFVLTAAVLAITACTGNNNKSETSGSGQSGSGSEGPVEITPAEGAQSFVYSSIEERTQILGILEKYAVENKLTGLTLFNNGGYVMYHPSVVKGATNYIPGFGFGILSEGSLNADLEGESNAAWKRYYHTYQADDPKTVNTMNATTSTVSDLQSYLTASYFDTYMNETRDGYNWVAGLAKQDRPTAINPDSNGLATKYRFEVKVGSELKYSTTTQVAALAEFNNREVQLEDYITPYKILYTQAYGMKRSGELSGAGILAGRKDYYAASKNGYSEEEFAKVGVKAVEQDGKAYLEFEFVDAYNPFFAMYYLSGGMMAPVPAAFIEALGNGNFAEGVKVWGASDVDGELSPLDTFLSTGPYMLERWDFDQQIVYKRNPNFNIEGKYNIQGVHMNILAAIKNNPEAALDEFLINKLHACGIPSTKLDDYKNDPRATTTIGSSNFKLNLNTCTQQAWEELFGENGSVEQTAPSDYWECEPAMANKDFVSGLSFAINRQEYAKNLGRNPAFEYFAPTYLSDPENGVSYNTTDAHKEAVKSLSEGTDGYGYSKELATKAFIKAANQLIADGVYEEGDKIELEIAWQEASDEQTFHAPIEQYLEEAFNVDENPLELDVKFWVGATWEDVYYKKMLVGQFDIGFGSISGDTYNPLSYLNILSTDKGISQGYCMNWGLNTNENTGEIVYNGHTYSFDGLWKAACEGGYLIDGCNSPLFSVTSAEAAYNADGEIVVSGTFDGALVLEGEGEDAELLAYGTMLGLCIFGCNQSNYSDYLEYYVYNTELYPIANDGADFGIPTDTSALVVDEEHGTFEATFSATVSGFFAQHSEFVGGFDAYQFTLLLGAQNAGFWGTIIDELPELPAPQDPVPGLR